MLTGVSHRGRDASDSGVITDSSGHRIRREIRAGNTLVVINAGGIDVHRVEEIASSVREWKEMQ